MRVQLKALFFCDLEEQEEGRLGHRNITVEMSPQKDG